MRNRKIAIFASGSGTNAQRIIEYFSENEKVTIDSIWSNNKNAYVLQRASNFGVKTYIFGKEEFVNSNFVVEKLIERKIDLIVLAGFLWLLPENLTQNFKIINIHPALLPKYGGKGMFGMNVHNSVVENRETESGISIHFVNDKYDDGELIFQAKCRVLPTDSPDDVANKIHNLEYKHFPEVIENVLLESD